MGENREVEVQDKRGTKDCPDLFANIVMKVPNTMATVSPKSHRKVSITSLSRTEAISLHKQLGELFEKEAKEDHDEDTVTVERGMGKSEVPIKKDFSGVVPGQTGEGKDGNAENVESNTKAKEEVGTQKQPETTKEEGSNSKEQSQAS